MEKTQTDTLEMNVPWFESPFFEKLAQESNLDEKTLALVKKFAKDGYVIVDPEILNFNEKADKIIHGLADEYREKGRIQDAWRFHPYVKEFALSPAILKLLKVLYQRDPIPFQTLNFYKGTEQKTHSDTVHFHSIPQRYMAGVWIALEDINANNGPLHYYPGSHKLPCYDLHDIGLSGSDQKQPYELYPQYENFVANLMKTSGFKREELNMPKGMALIWSANLFHGGTPIRDKNSTRHSQVTHYYFSNCRYYTPLMSDPYLGKVHWRQISDITTGRFVPHMYNGKKVNIPLNQRLYTSLRERLKSHLLEYPLMRKLKSFLKG